MSREKNRLSSVNQQELRVFDIVQGSYQKRNSEAVAMTSIWAASLSSSLP
jgi:hypothetical protein